MTLAIWKGCAAGNFHAGRPSGLKPEAIVIHVAASNLDASDQRFNNPAAKVSTHYLVSLTGEVHQYVHEIDAAFHAGLVVQPTWALIKPKINPNFYTIGIEHEVQAGPGAPENQMAASAMLVSEIAARWQIPVDANHIVAHQAIRATKNCPGTYISIVRLIELAAASSAGLIGATQVGETTSALRVRENANIDSKILRVLPAGSRILITGRTIGSEVSGNGNWFAIQPIGFVWTGAVRLCTQGPI